MITPELISRLKTELASGMSRPAIEQNLRIAGFAESDIADCFALVQAGQAAQQPEIAPSATGSATQTSVASAAPMPRILSEEVVQPAGAVAASPVTKKSPLGMVFLTGVIFLVLLSAGGAGAYAYMMKVGPFSNPPYSEANLISGLLDATSHIKSNAYKVQGSLVVVPRETDAVPFSIQVSNAEATMQKYGNDYQRARDVSSIIQYATYTKPPYPATLQQLIDAVLKKNSYLKGNVHATDPGTDLPYTYEVTQGGKDFNLTVHFETSDAIAALKKYQRYSSASSSTAINGLTVTFTSKSSSFFYLSQEPPKPYLVKLGEMMRLLSPDLSATLSASAATDWSEAATGWKFNIDAEGNFGDLSYKVNADALKKDDDYYFRINNLPSLFGFLSGVKGQWVKISAKSSTSTSVGSFNEYAYLASEIPKAESRYKEDREAFVAFVRKVATFADDERLVTLKNAPTAESVDGKTLYRYNLDLSKEAILPFYKKMVAAASADEKISQYSLFLDPGTEDYLQSDEFNQVFDYLKKNTTVTLWVDAQGYPEKLTYVMRIVPPDSATQLKDKQAMFTIEMDLTDINKPVDISAPADAKPIEKLEEDLQSNLDYSLEGARSNGRDARRIADIKQLQLALELYFNSKGEYPAEISNATLVTPGYISAIPKDPATSKSYVYAALGNGTCTGYHLGALLEDISSSLSTDADAKPEKTCTTGTTDFEGKSLTCGVTAATSDRCYDVQP